MLQDLKELYSNPDKVERIHTVINDYLTSMEKEMTLSPANDEEEHDPTVLLWLYYFMA